MSDNYVDLSDPYGDLSVIHVDLSDHNVDLSEKISSQLVAKNLIWHYIKNLAMVAYFCRQFISNVDLSDPNGDLSVIYVDLSDHYVDLSEKISQPVAKNLIFISC